MQRHLIALLGVAALAASYLKSSRPSWSAYADFVAKEIHVVISKTRPIRKTYIVSCGAAAGDEPLISLACRQVGDIYRRKTSVSRLSGDVDPECYDANEEQCCQQPLELFHSVSVAPFNYVLKILCKRYSSNVRQ